MKFLLPFFKRRVSALVASVFVSFSLLASAAAALPPTAPTIPNRSFNITKYGATSNVTSLNTAAIQRAIDQASAAGGGTVLIPEGVFVSGPIKLKSKIDLHLAKGAVLLMSQNFDDFPVVGNRRESFIEGSNLEDVRISGEGKIDGQGNPWWKAYLTVKGSDDGGPRRPQLIAISDSKRIELDGITTVNPPNTHCSLSKSKDITIKNLTMTAPDDSPNTDALNLSVVENVLINNCNISTGDDNIVLLCGGDNDPAHPKVKNVTIRDCKLGFGHGLSIGSFTSGGVQDVYAENISFDGTTSGIRLKAGRERGGGLVKNLTYKNMTMKNVRYPISIMSYYPKPPKGPAEDIPSKTGNAKTPEWTDILIEDITITDSKNSIIVWGLPDKPVERLTLKNVKAAADVGAVIFHANVTFSGVEITPKSGPLLQVFDANVLGMESVPLSGDYKPR